MLVLVLILVLCSAHSFGASSYSIVAVSKHGLGGMTPGQATHGFVTGFADMWRRRLKDILSKLCFVFIVIDLFEEVVETIPFLRKVAGRVGVHHSMLLLTVSHMLHHSEDVLKGIEERQHHRNQIEKENYIKKVLDQKYISAEEAAVAHDKAIVAVYRTDYPLAAALNYPERILEYLSLAEIKAVKYSVKHKGIYKDTTENCWRVCDLMIGQPNIK